MSCSVCRRDDAGAINAALRLGGPTGTVRAVADRHNVGKSLLAEHRATCLKLEGRTAPALPGPSGDLPGSTSPKPIAHPPQPIPAPDKSTDKSGQARTSEPDSPCATPRARGQRDPKGAQTFQERSLVCADIIASGQWDGHPTVEMLASLWHVDAAAVRNYHRAGRVKCALDGGDTAALLEDTLGSLRRQEQHARGQAERLEALAGEYEEVDEIAELEAPVLEARGNKAVKLRATAAKYRDLELKARSKLADVGGLVKLQVQVSVDQDPRVAAFVDRLLTAIDDLGEALRTQLADHAGQNGGVVPALPDPRAFVEERVRALVAGEKGLPS